jgi:hypothetical protein
VLLVLPLFDTGMELPLSELLVFVELLAWLSVLLVLPLFDTGMELPLSELLVFVELLA